MNTIFTRRLTHTLFASVAALTAGVLALGTLSGQAQADDHASKAKVGHAAPDFTLVDLEGNEHTLSDYTADGKIVVLEWFSPKCPFVVKHYKDQDNSTINTIAKDYKDQDVVVLAINSAKAGHSYADRDTNIKTHEDWGMTHPILMDTPGDVGRAYGAEVTPHMYIIDTDGVLRYAGALDNDRSVRGIGDVNYVRQALDEIIAGETVSTPETKAYGCSVKY